ncbi:putative OpcA protein [Beutenbergia cavernae DSM 12333]|uniref:Putative OpcA protein n=1 Tax=Beutenbergia cavernae (strain ATCC BAA-8 / DSM 12333 / CCUG 43141 / JCM 11478 / NBRC 16432 / NCIMB 13614 / HKI 0122) TaxID=471853 RepID=C5BV29_BEUC1|nr:glucose-6-phosphate dehydrogenase assembly protein OpcA [Beutenbergia cavernae]ACQ80416.1 putative OpcA protein [Beutenbergia cavernae DSM 12333]
MIIRLEETTTSKVAARLVALREEGGAVALGRVLTLIVVVNGGDLEEAVDAANDASREHPCRVIVIVAGAAGEADGLDAEIRVGGDAGASEVIVLRPHGAVRETLDTLVMPLLLPDAPIVTWWTHEVPVSPAESPLGVMAQRRITDVLQCPDPRAELTRLAAHHSPGDTDLAWARATLWRGLISAALDEPPFETVRSVTITGNSAHPSVTMLAAWLGLALRTAITVEHEADAVALTGVRLTRAGGDIAMVRPEGSSVLHITRPDGIKQKVSLPLRTLSDCLVEELRRLDPDEVYGTVLTKGLARLAKEEKR